MIQSQLRFAFIAFVFVGLVTLTSATVAEEPSDGAAAGAITVRKLGISGPLEIVDGGWPVLRYNYQTVSAPPEAKDRIREDTRKFAVPRSDYIHPLYGPHGEILTDDWVPDHPHHRGIYWAWPEVDWQGRRGDLHALQQVFAHPTGKIDIEQDPNFVQITAENEWRWDDGTPIVREQAIIRAYRQKKNGRAIDLCLRFTAVGADVQVARRGQAHYGGLNVRLAPAKQQEIATFTDPPGTTPRRAWADRSGVPQGGQAVVGLTILQNPLNPNYPGDWVQYPEISWVQPTFPAVGTRYTMTKDRPLELRYRLWIHEAKLGPEALSDLWATYNTSVH
jgi:hypothetical protein